jgi:hypothetical protein
MKISRYKETIRPQALMGISILFEDDLYQLARLLVKIHHAQDEEANRKSGGTRRKSCSTLLGLAHKYAYLSNVPSQRVEDALKQGGLSLGTTIDDEIP